MIGIRGPSTPTQLSGLTGMDPATITRAATRLSRLGLLSRSAHESDSRSVLLDLTPRGKELCTRIVPKVERSGDVVRKLYSPAEFALLLELIDRMDDAIAEGLFDEDDGREDA